MMPQTEFFRRSSDPDLWFLIEDGRYFTSSSEDLINGNFIQMVGRRVPLVEGETLVEEEKRYIRKHDKELNKLRAQVEREVSKGEGIDGYRKSLEIAEDLNFFLTEVCHKENSHLPISEPPLPPFSESNNSEFTPILPNILPGKNVVLIRRVFPLRKINFEKNDRLLSYISLNGEYYVLGKSLVTIEDVENEFQRALLQRIRIQATKDSKNVKELIKKIAVLEVMNEGLVRDLKVNKYPFAYECGKIGFDISARCIYYLIEPHYNSTTCRSYTEWQSAGTLGFTKKKVGTLAKFASREDRNHAFAISTHSHCLGGLKLHGDTLEEKMYYLRGFACVIHKNGAFYYQAQSSE